MQHYLISKTKQKNVLKMPGNRNLQWGKLIMSWYQNANDKFKWILGCKNENKKYEDIKLNDNEHFIMIKSQYVSVPIPTLNIHL